MNVAQLIDRIIDAYPGASGPAMGTFRQAYADRLRRHEGSVLAKAANDVFGSFKPTTRQPFPIPIDFEQHLPSGKLNLPSDGPQLDFRAHRERRDAILAEWLEAEGDALIHGVEELRLAFDHMARPIADRMAWNPQHGALRLSRAQIQTVQKRAVSQRRRRDYGAPSKHAEVWWDQIVEVQQRWDIDLSREDWTAPETTRRSEAA